jgi:Ca-activated chloride channel homolog
VTHGLLAAGCVAIASSVAAFSQASFKSKVEVVRVDVLVTERGRPVLDLRPGDFEITDNGVPQRVDYASFEQIPLNVVLTLDASDSLAGERLQHLLAAGNVVLDRLKADDQAALVTFGHAIDLRSKLVRDRDTIRRALASVRAGGETSLVDAAYAGLVVGESDVGRALVLIFSDGLDVTSWLQPEAVVDIARRSDVVVYGVAVRTAAKPEFLSDLGDATGGDLIEVESTRDLAQTFTDVLNEFRHRYLVSYEPRGVEKGGWHRVEVKVKRPGVRVKARPGYLSDASPEP